MSAKDNRRGASLTIPQALHELLRQCEPAQALGFAGAVVCQIARELGLSRELFLVFAEEAWNVVEDEFAREQSKK